MTARNSIVLTAILASFAACGGSGGGSDNPQTPQGTARIDATNAESVAAAALDASSGLITTTGSGNLFAATVAPDPGFDLGAFLADSFLRVAPGNGGVLAATLVSSSSCGTGSMETWLDDRDGDGSFSSGDSMEFRFLNCGDGGYTINGSMFFEAVVFSGNQAGDNFSVSMTVRFANLTATGPGGTVTYDGTISSSVTYQNGVFTYSYSISGNFGGLRAGSTVRRSIGQNGEELVDGDGAFAFGDQTLSFDTTTPFATRPGASTAYAGACVVGGSGGSGLIITALDEQNLRIEVDQDGDGVFETVINTTWAALRG